MNKIIIVLMSLIIIMLGIVGYFLIQDSNEPPITIEQSGDIVDTPKGLAELATVNSVRINEEVKGSNRVVNAVYPSIQSFSNKNFQKYINDEITKVIFAYRDEINAIVDDKTPATALYTYETTYDKYTHGDYLSLVISNNYETGGIRSNQWKDIYNVNVRTERLLYLKDIFPSNVDYKKEILKEIKEQAKEKNYELMNGNGLTELNDNQKFFIKDEKLIIYFDAAEIAPASYGILQFEMPFRLDEDGLFRRAWKIIA